MLDRAAVLFDFSRERLRRRDERPVEIDCPLVPLTNVVLFPHIIASLTVGRSASLAAIDAAMSQDRLLIVVAQRDPDADDVQFGDLHPIGVEVQVQRVMRMPDGTTEVLLVGQRRVKLLSQTQERPYMRVRAMPLYEEDNSQSLAVEAMRRSVLSLFEKVVKLSRTLPDDSYVTALNVDDPGGLADLITATLPLDVARKQEVLETVDIEERLRRLSILLVQELDVLELESRIQNQVQREVDRSQRDFLLREQLKAIQRELGQDDPNQREILRLRTRLEERAMPDVARARARDELERLEMVPFTSPEYGVLRTYLDWMIDLPWLETSEDHIDLREAARILDENHFGLEKVKERILEFMAVKRLAGPLHRTPILCFVGPPGVGKTSLGESIAKAIGRKFVRISLGGVDDEAEIRGHRRTYIGSLPGRILQTMKRAQTINPVFMLDEIDKLSSDFRGDPADALLEVLDPEQNREFSDHYLEIPYDLSQVLFITTANITDPIPDALLDRLEVIELGGYTEEEKVSIAERFLVPRQLESNGLGPDTLKFDITALQTIIRDYTYEAGVRNLEREIGAVCRKTARRIAEEEKAPEIILPGLVRNWLGPARYTREALGAQDEVGISTGLSWTSNGGDLVTIEVALMEGKGALTLTGQLGDVMQESAQAAFSYMRAMAKPLGIDVRRFDKFDIHVHVPDGAVPKDGPSAGITIAIALISAFTGRAVRRDTAMTGEITLRGRVLGVGGLKEKLLAAYRAGITNVIIPRESERFLEDVPAHALKKLHIIPVERMDQVIDAAIASKHSKAPTETENITPTS